MACGVKWWLAVVVGSGAGLGEAVAVAGAGEVEEISCVAAV